MNRRIPFPLRRLLMPLCTITMTLLLTGCTHPLKQKWRAYREAKRRGDYDAAARYLSDDARIWFGEKEGPGKPLTAKGGPYKDWDKVFRSTSTRDDVHVVGRTLTYISQESNDFYRLIDGIPTKARVTYYFDEHDRISGMLYKGLTPKEARPPDRFDEFKQWAAERYPGLLDSEEMEIPNNPKRWRALLTEWRRDVGLPPIE